MSDWALILQGGMPDAPAMRILGGIVRMSEALYRELGRPEAVDLLVDRAHNRVGVRVGQRHLVRKHDHDVAWRVHSTMIGRMIAASSSRVWLPVADCGCGVWAAFITLRESWWL